MAFRYGGVSKDDLNNYERFPEGTYEFYIDSIQETENDYGDEVVEIVLKPSDFAMQKYGKVWHRINLNNEWTNVNVGRFLMAVGEDPEISCEINFSLYSKENLTAKIKHKTDKNGKTYVNAMLLPKDGKKQEGKKESNRTRERVRSHEYAGASSLAQEWDGESGRDDDDIPF